MHSSTRLALMVSLCGVAGLAQADTRISFPDVASNISGTISVDTPFGSQTSSIGPLPSDSAAAGVSGTYEGQPTDPSDLPFLGYSFGASITGGPNTAYSPDILVSGRTSGGVFDQFASTAFTATIQWNATLTNTTKETGPLVITTLSNASMPASDTTILWNGQEIQAEPNSAVGSFVPHFYSLGNFAPGESGVLSYSVTDSHPFADAYTGRPSPAPSLAIFDQFGIAEYRIAAPVAAVPEPTTGALLAVAMGGLLWVRRRKG